MDKEYRALMSHGNLVTTVHCRQTAMLTREDFTALLDSDSIEDICVKLQRQYPAVVGMKKFTREELKKRLSESLLGEIRLGTRDSLAREQLSFFTESYKIQNFFFLLSCKEYDADLEKNFPRIEFLGYFNELDTLKFCTSMDEVHLYCIKRTFLSGYCVPGMFKKEFGENDFSTAHAELRKRHIERYAACASRNFLKLLRLEGDKHNLDIVLSTLGTEISAAERLRWMTPVTNFSHGPYQALARATDSGELRSILSATRAYRALCEELREKDLGSVFLKKEIEAYHRTFESFNDITSLYAYFKLREQEIKNILWVAERVSQGKKDTLDGLLLPA